MKNNAVTVCGGGIKCDNPSCDFVDERVEIKDYIHWLNKPCPKCGCNLLTQSDYNNVQMLLLIKSIVNDNFEPVEDTDKENTITVHMNGSGVMDLEINVKEEIK